MVPFVICKIECNPVCLPITDSIGIYSILMKKSQVLLCFWVTGSLNLFPAHFTCHIHRFQQIEIRFLELSPPFVDPIAIAYKVAVVITFYAFYSA